MNEMVVAVVWTLAGPFWESKYAVIDRPLEHILSIHSGWEEARESIRTVKDRAQEDDVYISGGSSKLRLKGKEHMIDIFLMCMDKSELSDTTMAMYRGENNA